MAIRWKTEFLTITEKKRTINIYDPSYTGTAVSIVAAANPFVIDDDDSDDFFLPVRTQSGLFTFIDDDRQLAKQMLSDNPLNRKIELLDETDNVMWEGYLKCESYDQDLLGVSHAVSIPVVCPLTLLQGIEVPQDEAFISYYKSFYQLLQKMQEAAGISYIQTYDDTFDMNTMKLLYISPVHWLEQLTEINYDGKAFKAGTLHDVLTDICKYFGVTARMYHRGMYLVRPDKDTHIFNTPTWKGNSITERFLPGYRGITMKADISVIDDPALTIPTSSAYRCVHENSFYFSATKHIVERNVDPEPSSKRAYIYSHMAVYDNKGHIMATRDAIAAGSPNPYFKGGLFEELEMVTAGATTSLKGMLFSSYARNQSWNYPCFTYKTVSPVLMNHYINRVRISGKGKFIDINADVLNEGYSSAYPFYMSIKYGMMYAYIDSTDKSIKWNTDSSNMITAILTKKGVLCKSYNEGTGLINETLDIPLPDTLGCSIMTIELYGPNLYPDSTSERWFMMDSFSVEPIDVNQYEEDHTYDVRYSNGFKDIYEHNLNLGTQVSRDEFGSGVILTKDSSSQYIPLGKASETSLFNRLTSHFNKRERIIEATVKHNDETPFYGFAIEDEEFGVLSRSINYADETQTVKLIQLKQEEENE